MASQRQKTDSVRKALLRLHYEKFTSVTIQPLQTIFGHEHEMVREAARKVCQETGLSCRVGLPLLGAMSELSAVASALLSYLPEERKVTDDVVFMGHGAHHAAMSQYEDLGRVLNGIDKHAHLGAMNGITMLNDILPRLKSGIVWLLPLLSIIGQHALRDMAGDNPRSWRSRIEAAGHVCKPVLRGMIENRSVSEIWLNHLSAAHAREAD